MQPLGFNVIGHVSANVGLGVVARNAIRLILQKGHSVATLDIDPGRGRSGHDTTYDHLGVGSADDLPYGVSLVILSITALPDILIDKRVRLRDDVLNAGYFWWELPVISDVWAESLEQFDVLIAGSEFLRSTFERRVSGTPAIHAPQPLHGVDGIHPDRDKFGIPHGKIAFVCIVEPTSDPIRKNPYASIAAFRKAFKPEDPAHLVVKINNAQATGQRASLSRLREAVSGLGARATLIEDSLPHRDVMQLFASCDVFVGLHRAEGFGLALMEAMALGKPVIATGWSGNMSFMNHFNSCLVGYRLIPVVGSVGAYSPGFLKQDVRWADPDLDEAAALMKGLVADPRYRESIGRNAAADINRYRAEAERGRFVDELQVLWERAQARSPRSAGHAEEIVKRLRQARFHHKATPMERVRAKSRALLDRHLSWRFRSR